MRYHALIVYRILTQTAALEEAKYSFRFIWKGIYLYIQTCLVKEWRRITKRKSTAFHNHALAIGTVFLKIGIRVSFESEVVFR